MSTTLTMIGLGLVILVGAAALHADDAAPKSEPCENCQCDPGPGGGKVHSFTARSIDGEDVALSRYAGKTLLIVNVASRCGYTKQYADLQALYESHRDQGLEILAFPCNQFKGQEPGTAEEIKAFCTTKYNVSFPLFDKIDVNGESAHPLYQYLTSDALPIEDKGPVKWNFEKFLVDREGNVVARFRSKVNPRSEEMLAAIDQALSAGSPQQAAAE